MEYNIIRKIDYCDFPDGLVDKNSPSSAGVAASIPGQGDVIPQTLWPETQGKTKICNIVKKQTNKINKDLKQSASKMILKKKKKKNGL